MKKYLYRLTKSNPNLKKSLKSKFNFSVSEFKTLEEKIQKKIDNAWDNALKDSPPEWSKTKKYLFNIQKG